MGVADEEDKGMLEAMALRDHSDDVKHAARLTLESSLHMALHVCYAGLGPWVRSDALDARVMLAMLLALLARDGPSRRMGCVMTWSPPKSVFSFFLFHPFPCPAGGGVETLVTQLWRSS